MKLRNLGVGALTALMATMGMGIATATAREEYRYYDGQYYGIAYNYVYYADAEKNQMLGTAYDTCTHSYDPQYAGHVLQPFIPTAYYDETVAFYCGGMGPMLLD